MVKSLWLVSCFVSHMKILKTNNAMVQAITVYFDYKYLWQQKLYSFTIFLEGHGEDGKHSPDSQKSSDEKAG